MGSVAASFGCFAQVLDSHIKYAIDPLNEHITQQDPLLVAEEEGGLYQAERQLMVEMLEALVATQHKQGKGGNKLRADMLEGDWELVRGFLG